MKGTFSEEALLQFANLVSQTQSADFSEGETYDFTRCVKPDGKAYGTRGKCKKGTEQTKDPDEKAAIKQLGGMLPKGEKIMDSKGSLHTAAGKPKSMESLKTAAARAKAKFNKEEMESPKNQADMDHAGLMKLMANSPTAQRKLREAAEAKAKAGK